MISAQNLQESRSLASRWRAISAGLSAFLLTLLFLAAGCSSSTQPFNDTPAVGNLFPTNATAGGQSFTLNISGTGFIATSSAYWNNTLLTTTFDANTLQISASIPAAFIANPGVAQVTVVSPGPGGGISNAVTFTINPAANPTPTITSLNPSSTPLNVLPANSVLVVTGTNFIQSSTAAFNGVSRTPAFVSATQLNVPLTAADVAANTTISVTVSNPSPGGGVSNAASFVVGLGHNARLKSNATAAGAILPEVVSVSASGGASNGRSAAPAISADGRFVAFYSAATNLVANGAEGNIFLRDTCLGAADCTPQTIPVDLAPDGSAPNGSADAHVAISADGRFVAFASAATNLASGGVASAAGTQVYVRDLCVGTNAPSGCVLGTQLVSVDHFGAAAPNSSAPSISADGRFVAFVSGGDVLVRDTCVGLSSSPCVARTYSIGSQIGLQVGEASSAPAISSTERYIAFVATEAASSNASQVLLADMCLGTGVPASCRPALVKISVSADGSDIAGANQAPSISADGRFVAFESTNADGTSQVLLHDTCLGGSAVETCAASTALVSANASDPSISANGRYISYSASAPVSAGSLYIYDSCYQAPAGCSVGSSPLPLASDAGSFAQFSADGSEIVFSSTAAIAGVPLSGQGDVLLLALPF